LICASPIPLLGRVRGVPPAGRISAGVCHVRRGVVRPRLLRLPRPTATCGRRGEPRGYPVPCGGGRRAARLLLLLPSARVVVVEALPVLRQVRAPLRPPLQVAQQLRWQCQLPKLRRRARLNIMLHGASARVVGHARGQVLEPLERRAGPTGQPRLRQQRPLGWPPPRLRRCGIPCDCHPIFIRPIARENLRGGYTAR
jgi:hypothetical protein